MTTETLNIFSGPYTGTGAAGQAFPVTFQSTAEDEIIVYAAGIEVDQSDYVFTRDDDGRGTVVATLTGAVYIYSTPSFEQETDFQRFGGYFPDDFNAPLDRAARRDQYLKALLTSVFRSEWLLPGARAGRFLAWDGDENPVAASGTGSDSAFRTDAAASGGAALVGTKRPEASTVALSQSTLNEFVVVSPRQWGCTGSYSQDATTGLQAMFDEAPAGAIVDLAHGMDTGGDYKITGTVYNRRGLSIRGRNSRIVGVMADNNTDLLVIDPSAEIRDMTITGVRLAFNSGGRDALRVNGASLGVLGLNVAHCNINGGAGGWGVNIIGVGCHFNTLFDNDIAGTATGFGAVRLACADGTALLGNRIEGIGCGVLLLLINGSLRTWVKGGTIGIRDGGILMTAAQQVSIEDVQFEQDVVPGRPGGNDNQATYKAHIAVLGAGTVYNAGGSEDVSLVNVRRCNFGTGPHCDAAIILAGYCREFSVDECYFSVPGNSGVDIQILSATVVATSIGLRNRVGGLRTLASRGTVNTLDPKDLLLVSDSGTGTYGYAARKTATALSLQNSWTASTDFCFWKDAETDNLRFLGHLIVGTVTATTLIGTLPLGFRPAVATYVTAFDPANGVPFYYKIDTNGQITVKYSAAGGLPEFSSISIPIKGQSYFLSGPF